MSKGPTALTERQQFSLRHLRACGDGCLKAYAAAHRLSLSSLHEARSKFRRQGVLSSASAGFVRVQRTESSPGSPSALWRIHLRNGAVVEVTCPSEHWSRLLSSVAAFP